jgi:hypothetical protein
MHVWHALVSIIILLVLTNLKSKGFGVYRHPCMVWLEKPHRPARKQEYNGTKSEEIVNEISLHNIKNKLI